MYLLTQRPFSSATVDAYQTDIEQFKEFLTQENILLQSVTLSDIRKYLVKLNRRKLKDSTVIRKIITLKSLFNYLHERYDMPNLGLHLTLPKQGEKLPEFLTQTDIAQLFKAADVHNSRNRKRNKLMIYMMYCLGVRVSELVTIELADIRFDERAICITGKGGKQRLIPLNHELMDLLKKYLATEHKEFCDRQYTLVPYLFPVMYRGKPHAMSRWGFSEILKAIWKKTGINKRGNPHSLRHSIATHLLSNGANIRALQALLGHESINSTMIYTHVETSRLRKEYDDKHWRS